MTTQKRALGNSLERAVVEKATKAGVKAKRQPRSGELKEFPADAVVADVLVEAKVRSATLNAKGKKVLSIDMDWLSKVQDLARGQDMRAGVVVFRMKGSQKLHVVVDYDFFLSLLLSQTRVA